METINQIQKVIDLLPADKSISQPWRNMALSDARRLLALVEMGKRSTNLLPPPDIDVAKRNSSDGVQGCHCKDPNGKRDIHCPVHGLNG